MRLVIKIPEKLAEKGHWYTDEEMWTVIKAAQNGTPIPDNATNGQVMESVFRNDTFELKAVDYSEYGDLQQKYILQDGYTRYYNRTEIAKNWWNAPYQKGGKA